MVTSGRQQPPAALDARRQRLPHRLARSPDDTPRHYAFGGTTIQLLWHNDPSNLDVGRKYAAPAAAHGLVLVATDALAAFGLR